MGYVVLARKYRPLSFGQMVGQGHVVRALTNALTQGRLHHAYLFTGTRGIGKTTVSRILAKSLNCTGPDGTGGVTAEPCGVCTACTEIDGDRYIDYIELDAASNRGIDEARDLIERASYKPGVGRFKVFMIDEAHQLTKDAFSALLKTLEEPPPYLKFVLATTDPEKMLPTVLSRCLQFHLRPMAPEVVGEHLARVLDAEHVEHEPAALRLLGRAARGSMRDALSLTDQAIAYGGGRVEESVVRSMLGAVDRSHPGALVRALAARDGAAVLERVGLIRDQAQSAAGALEAMALLLQRMAVEQAVPGGTGGDDDEAAEARELAALMPPDETQLLYSIVLHGREELRLLGDEHAALTMVLLRLLAFAPQAGPATSPLGTHGGRAGLSPVASTAPSSGAPVAAVSMSTLATTVAERRPAWAGDSLGAGVAERGTQLATEPLRVSEPATEAASRRLAAPRAEPAAMASLRPAAAAPLRAPAVAAIAVPVSAPAAPTPAANDDAMPAAAALPAEPAARSLGDRWHALVQRLDAKGAITALVRELALQSELVVVDETVQPPCWRLRVERETLRAPERRDRLAAAMAAELDTPLQLELEAGTAEDTPARRDAAERARRQSEAERAIRDDPLVRELMSQFGSARIVPGSIKPV